MKQAIACIILCFALIGQAQAQRYLPKQKGIQITGALADDFTLKKRDGQAFYAGLAVSSYNKKGNRWVFGGDYFQRLYGYKDILIPVSQITGEGGFYYKFLSDPSKTCFFSVGGSALAGYETQNWGKKLLFDGASINGKDSFIYGAALTLEMETFLTDRLVFLVNVRERMLLGSAVNKFRFQAGIGLKIIIN